MRRGQLEVACAGADDRAVRVGERHDDAGDGGRVRFGREGDERLDRAADDRPGAMTATYGAAAGEVLGDVIVVAAAAAARVVAAARISFSLG